MVVGIYGENEKWMRHVAEEVALQFRVLAGRTEVYCFREKAALWEFYQAPLDVLFLDLDLREKDGIVIADGANRKWANCQIVFYSEDINLATEVYGTAHIFFVLKEQLKSKMQEILRVIVKNSGTRQKRLIFSGIGGKTIILRPEEISFFERVKRVTRIESTYGTYEIWEKLDDLEKRLPSALFVRCHNSYIVYLPSVVEVQKNILVLKNSMRVMISRSYQKAVQNALDRYLTMPGQI